MATPHVAGILARYRDAHPAATVAQIRSAVASTAVDIEAPGRDNNTGYGLLDAYELLAGQDFRVDGVLYPPLVPALGTITPGAGSLAVTWSAPSSDGGSAVTGWPMARATARMLCSTGASISTAPATEPAQTSFSM